MRTDMHEEATVALFAVLRTRLKFEVPASHNVGTVTGLRADDPGILFLFQARDTFWILQNAKDGCEIHPAPYSMEAETFTLRKPAGT